MTTIRPATHDDLPALARLFDGYRQFYGATSDIVAATAFLSERLSKQDSALLVAESNGDAVAFTQLYPSFSSLSMGRIWILNDLFVSPSARRSGLGAALLETALEYARKTGALRLALSTQLTNTAAQRLYEAQGWVRDAEFCTYTRSL